VKDMLQVTEVLVLRYKCMGALKEYHWDAKGSTYGNLPIRIGKATTSEATHLWTTDEPAFHY
jgi:hypothetical protein